MIELLTVEGDLISRCELFDEADLDAALARFDELSRPAPRLENAASRQNELYRTYFASRDWKAMAAILADDVVTDDRRRVVNAGVRQGRDAELANLQTLADVDDRQRPNNVNHYRDPRTEPRAQSSPRPGDPD